MPWNRLASGYRKFHTKRFMPARTLRESVGDFGLGVKRRTSESRLSRKSRRTSIAESGALFRKKYTAAPPGGLRPTPTGPAPRPPRPSEVVSLEDAWLEVSELVPRRRDVGGPRVVG